ncbi:MAG: S9 family peptidase [Betaproteobacteria bacterium]|nr:prolyl oligopeptidase family serine peptidase [Betaproteobacteria bacterium]MDE2049043.1 S9 family peptidase [Betaproteobacteria bacterium]
MPSAATLPVAPVKNVQDTFFGTKVDDPYRYFENIKDPEVAAWMKAQSDYAHAMLHAIPGRAALLDQVRKFDDAVPAVVGDVQRLPGDVYFFERRGAADNQFKLFKQVGLKGKEQLLVDPDAIQKKTGKPHAINYYFPSPDGRYVAYGLSAQGSEAAFLHVLDTQTGKTLGQPISRADYGSVDWAPDGKSFLFNRLQEVKKGMPATAKYERSAVWRVQIKGNAPAMSAQPAIGPGTPGVTLEPVESPVTWTTYDGRWVVAAIINGVQREIGIDVAPLASVQAGKPQWKRVVRRADKVTAFAYYGDTLYLQSNQGASRGQVLALDLKAPDMASAKVVVPASERVITGMAAASDALYIEARVGNIKHLFKLGYGAGAALAEVTLPVQGTFSLVGFETLQTATDPRLPGAVFSLQGWTQARQIYDVKADGSVVNTGLQPRGPYDAPTDLVTTEVLVKSYDGAMVPMSIVMKKGTQLDGNNPTLLYGYASYGITEEPRFNPARLAWLDRGGVFAVANPRGSGVYGEDWYKGGFQATKPNTWKDFIACAEYLIAQKYTQPAKLGILGGSAGGILVGRAMTTRPDLFAAVVSAVGALDAVRFETSANGVTNIPEFGTVKTEAGFKSVLEMSTYAHIEKGVKYPAVLFIHGTHDPRVEVWESTKTAARLMAATASGKPVLLRLDYNAGHGIGNTKSQRQAETADIYSFLLWNMGVPGFAPQ